MKVIEKRPVRWVLVLGWMSVIFAFSNQAHSGEITGQYLGEFNLVVRKSAHMTEYAILFCLLKWALLGHVPKKQHISTFFAYLTAVLYAASDEWHQQFVPGRSSSWEDVFVDTIGVNFGWIFWYYFLVLRSFWSSTRKPSD
ncbi:MAG TPA: VanZ family protein [Chroococcales cyanobacterium]